MSLHVAQYVPKPVNPSPVSAFQIDDGAALVLGHPAGDWVVIDETADTVTVLSDAEFTARFNPA